MTLPQFIKKYHGATADHLAGELFGEKINEDQDLTYPNNYIMILMHQIHEMNGWIIDLEQQVEILKNMNERK